MKGETAAVCAVYLPERRLSPPLNTYTRISGDDLLSKVVNGIIATKPLNALLTAGAKSVRRTKK